MAAWLAIAAALLKALLPLFSYLEQKQGLDAGAAQAVAAHLQGALDEIRKAQTAADAVSADPGELRKPDKFSRD